MNKFFNKGQGALEYLIIIGAAILVAVIVVSLVISVSRSNSDQTTKSNDSYNTMVDNTIIPPMILNVDCNTSHVTFTINYSATVGVTHYCVVFNGVPNITAGCIQKDSTLIYPQAMTVGTKYNYSLVAKKGDAYSQPVAPSSTCTAHS